MNAPAAEPSLDAAARAQLIADVVAQLRQHYLAEDRLPAIEARLQASLDGGNYSPLSGAELARAITADLQAIGGSGHLYLRFRTEPLALGTRPATEVERTAQRAEERHVNYGLTRAEVLPGNVGYLRMERFGDVGAGGRAVAGAMSMLTQTDAMIVDLRDNRGGGELSVVLASYFLPPESQHLSTLEYPRRGETIQLWSLPSVPGPRYLNRPVYVLTSPRTFSAGEAFAYNLQAIGRVKVVGERTRGGADPIMVVPVHPHFSLSIPIGRTVHPMTKTSWEGVGVIPDIPVDSGADALSVALQLAKGTAQ